jgi:hypothetical protein
MNPFTAHTMTNTHFFWPTFLLDYVPDENIGKNLKGLFIRQSNLKYFDDEIVNTNLKKMCYQDLLAEYPRDIIIEICLLYWLFLTDEFSHKCPGNSLWAETATKAAITLAITSELCEVWYTD